MFAFLLSSSFVPSSVVSTHFLPNICPSHEVKKIGAQLPKRRNSTSPIVSAIVDADPSFANSTPQMPFPVRTMEQFWKLADESKAVSQYEADSHIQFLTSAPLEDVKAVCLQYRYFVERYPDNLAKLLSRMENDQLKCLLAEIFAEELGSGQIRNAHIVWYDNFLLSLGISKEDLAKSIYPENDAILCDIARRCSDMSIQHAIGLVGMGGECLCQIYLTVMHKFLMKNQSIQAIKDQVDWTFWVYHIGEEDIEHRKLVRACIDNLGLNGTEIGELADGYKRGKNTWDDFWSNNYKNTSLFDTGSAI